MKSALSAALCADTDHLACFGRDGAEHYWSELIAAASATCERMNDEPGQRWALNIDDTFLFAGALLGLWAASKTPVLAPRPMLESGSADVAIDGVVEVAQAVRPVPGRRYVALKNVSRASRSIDAISSSAQLVLYTSGSTGRPKEVCRAVRHVEAELEVLESLWGEQIASCRMFSTVSHRHIYGLLFRVLWPLLARRPLATFDLEYPEQLTAEGAEGQALVSSPALLKRIGHLPNVVSPWRAVFSSGGLLSGAASADSARVLGTHPVEVLGSTETSGVAWRRQVDSDASAWKVLPRVEVRVNVDGYLEVRSPFTGQAAWLQMGDMARTAADGAFELLGRGDHVAKIEDKRVSLTEIERRLSETEWVDEAAAVATEDGGRQYVGVLLKLSEAGMRELDLRGTRAFNELLKATLRSHIEEVALPRKVRYVEDIPVDSQGKRLQASLRKFFPSS